MSITEFQNGLWSIARYSPQLAEEDVLDAKPTNLKSHLRRRQKHTCVLGEILDVHSSTLPLFIAQALFYCHNFDHLYLVSVGLQRGVQALRANVEGGSHLAPDA